ncbi:MAG: serpin family protein [Lachnospiraceae bacterium]|nr:serpin family protein [Lachnospiraceae bacterium]
MIDFFRKTWKIWLAAGLVLVLAAVIWGQGGGFPSPEKTPGSAAEASGDGWYGGADGEGSSGEALAEVPASGAAEAPSEAATAPAKPSIQERPDFAEKVSGLYEAKSAYIGNASQDGRLIQLLKSLYEIEESSTMELQTELPPYGLTLHFKEEPDRGAMEKASVVFLSLVDNAFSVSWDYPVDDAGNREYFYLDSHFFKRYGGGGYIKEQASSEEALKNLLIQLEEFETSCQPLARKRTLESAVAAAILMHNRDIYPGGNEAFGEGHIILEQKEEAAEAEDTESENTVGNGADGRKRVTVYALTMYGAYQFQDGNFVKNGGSGVLPVVMEFSGDPDGSYVLLHYQEPLDGGDYGESIQKMFPKSLWKECLSPAGETTEELKRQETAYAERYLKSIKREAVIGDYGDFEHPVHSDEGISVEVSNKLMEEAGKWDPDSPAAYAPFWLGNVEQVEDGVRYLYEHAYDSEKREISYSKIQYDTGKLVSRVVYDADTGQRKPSYEGVDAQEAMMDISLELLRENFKEKNVLISPLSIISALGMTANGAKNQTLAEMEQVLPMEVGMLNEYLRDYREALSDDEANPVHLANSIWLKDSEQLIVQDAFLRTCQSDYAAAVWKAPFDDSTKKDINLWVKKETNGMISELLEEAPPKDAVMYLVNALTFDGEWAEIYEKNQVHEGSFHALNGREQAAEFMGSMESVYLELESAAGFIKPYQNGAYAFVALLPEEGVELGALLSRMDGQKMMSLLENQQSWTVSAKIPRFTVESSILLNDSLKRMGMKEAFDRENADFSAMAESADGNLFISKVLHKTKIEVAERGTKAGAVTSVEMKTESAMIEPEEPKQVYLDRPFFYLILDTEQNMPLFAGCVTDMEEIR